jgi:serine/threonine protein kinase
MVMETLPQGTILYGRYRIERALGNGGFGHVYLSIDLLTNQQYAIKEYLVAGASGKAQLEHEARVLSQLHHTSLPAFQDAFDERGRYYVVLGYIEGSDLTDLIRIVRQRNEVVPLARILTWIISICDAVTFLHNQNPPVIHRDIKPDNIRITPDGTAILVDLGNAKATADGARTLFFIRHQGTPGYAPLEQYPGGSGTDTRSDVYALGGTLYFALTTHEPPSVSTRNQSIQQNLPDMPSLQEQLAHNPPEKSLAPEAARQFRLGVTKPAKPTPRHSRHLAQLGTLSPELLEHLNVIIKKAMAMKPKERYQSVAEMSKDLKSVLAALPASSPPSMTNSTRQVDPHSTQPDLPQLFESLQNAQAAQDISSPYAQPSFGPATPIRCPHCNAQVRPQATFCPQCGLSLSSTPQNKLKTTPPSASTAPSSPTQNSTNSTFDKNRPVPGTSAEPGMTVRPNYLNQPSTPQHESTASPISIPPKPEQNEVRSQSKPSTQDRIFPPAPSQVPPRSFFQTSAPALVKDIPNTPAQTMVSSTNSTNSVASKATRKILLYMVIVFIVVLLIIFFIVLKSLGHHSSGSIFDQHYAIAAQVYDYERNISLWIAPPTPHTRSW